ncbi:MFS transporter [Salininema proteolyticum]|uniref:MFS transporter n=1 Tax=Salininema proteolyticum TaxID=1607685 RepID=A0ABV8U0Y4_9ACTN
MAQIFDYSRFRSVLAIPRFKPLVLGGFFLRLPYSAASITLTLFVRFGLGESYFAAGLVATLFVLGQAAGSTLMGRISDHFGLRAVLAVTTLSSTALWAVFPSLGLPLLFAVAFPAGLLSIPVFVVVRQPIAAMVPENLRRTAYAADAVSVELAFAIAPATATVLVTALDPQLAPRVIAAAVLLSGTLIWLLNPPTGLPEKKAVEPAAPEPPLPPLRQWFTVRLAALMVMAFGMAFCFSGTDISIVSHLEAKDQIGMAWVPLALWALYSLFGALMLAGSHRRVSPLVLLFILGVCTAPLGLSGSWWILALVIIPSGFFTAMSVAAATDQVSRIAEPRVQGTAMGMQGSAMTMGAALGAPVVGWVVETFGAQWSFTATGFGVLCAALAAAALTGVGRMRAQPRRELQPEAA